MASRKWASRARELAVSFQNLIRIIGQTITEIVLVAGGSNNGQAPGANYGATIGLISVKPAAMSAPASAQSLAAQPIYSDQSTLGALLTWSYPAGAARYFDVWRTDGASPQWLLRAPANAAWIPGLAPLGRNFSATFAVQPIDYSLTAQALQSAAQAVLTINAMAFDDGPTIAMLGNPPIAGMVVMAGEILNAIQTTSGAYGLPQHGDTSGSANTITLAAGERITEATGATGIWYGNACVVQLTLKSSAGKTYGPYGTMGGVTSSTPFTFTAPSGQSIVAFSGSLVNVALAGGARVNIIQTLQPRYG